MNELIFTENNIEIIKENLFHIIKKLMKSIAWGVYTKEYKSMIEYVENYF